MVGSAERDEVERPFIEQLKAMGWIHKRGADLARSSREDVLLTDRLSAAVRRVNLLPDGAPWLDDDRVARVVQTLNAAPLGGQLIEDNRHATGLLLGGVSVPGSRDYHHGRWVTVQVVDWEKPERNEFLVVDQLRVDLPSDEYSILDLVLFVNGIPLAVVECKSPDAADPIGWAVRDLQGYAGEPLDWDGTDEFDPATAPVGVPRLFRTNQLLIATCGHRAALGTISSGVEHFAAWRSIEPERESTLRDELRLAGVATPASEQLPLTEQQVLVGVVLRPANLLDIVRHFVLFMPRETEHGPKLAKVVCRHQQYRAVVKALRGLRSGRTLRASGDKDRRGGLIWHTQGSGKSLTMAFLVRAMRSDQRLGGFMVVVVTDRIQLQQQLTETLRLTEDQVQVAETRLQVETLLRRRQPGVVLAMIQKYRPGMRELQFAGDADAEDGDDRSFADEELKAQQSEEANDDSDESQAETVYFPLCNSSDDILVIVDEAHRSHTSVLHACLSQAVPNAARIGFTGTPIVSGRKKTTADIFGEFLDEYRLEESERDGSTVRILYEGRTGPGRVVGRDALDTRFDDLLAERTPEQRAALAARWPTDRDVVESEAMIRAKAADILRHYIETVLPGGFKAQIAAYSREAAVTYMAALRHARDELLAELDAFNPVQIAGTPPEELDDRTRFLLAAARFVPLLRRMEFAPVISAGKEKKQRKWLEWTDPERQEHHIAMFQRPFPHLPPDQPWSRYPVAPPRTAGEPTHLPWDVFTEPDANIGLEPLIAFVIVKSMLLTGFDAPLEQVLYLDRPIREVELLQAVARVNRPASGKTAGYVVDYYGVVEHLDDALRSYDHADVVGVRRNLADEVPILERAHTDVRRFLENRRIVSLDTADRILAAVLELSDERDRLEYDELLATFTTSLETVLPRREALRHVPDARRYALLQKRLRRHYRDGRHGAFDVSVYGRKVRALIDEHLELPEIEQVIPPVSITSAGFDESVSRISDRRGAASEMAHALRYHLEERVRREDPARYRRLSERLEAILRDLQDRWEEQIAEIAPLIDEARREDDPNLTGLVGVELAVYGLLEEQLATDILPTNTESSAIRDLSLLVCDTISRTVNRAGYRGAPQDVTHLARTLFAALRGPWRQIQGAGSSVRDLEQLADRLAAYGQANLPRFRHRANQLEQY